MNKLAARLFFCSGPAMMFGLAAGLAFQSLEVAVIVCLAMFGFGLQITKDTKEGRSNG
jgi:hypothetical protein